MMKAGHFNLDYRRGPDSTQIPNELFMIMRSLPAEATVVLLYLCAHIYGWGMGGGELELEDICEGCGIATPEQAEAILEDLHDRDLVAWVPGQEKSTRFMVFPVTNS